MFLGDCHGDENFAYHIRETAGELECDLIIQVGDFTYFWQGNSNAHVWSDLPFAQSTYVDFPLIPVWFLAGNHEDWHMLDAMVPADFSHGIPPRGGLAAPNVHYLGRVNRFVIDGIRFLTVSGAFSVDKDRRKVGISWFPQETISEADIHNATEAGDCDILLAHDAPTTSALMAHFASMDVAFGPWFPEAYRAESRKNRDALEAIIAESRPKLLVHGHYHWRYETAYERTDTRVIGLDCNGSGRRAWHVLDTDEFKGRHNL